LKDLTIQDPYPDENLVAFGFAACFNSLHHYILHQQSDQSKMPACDNSGATDN
jgi:organic hydroperoxide reductase OsmC/OhrA